MAGIQPTPAEAWKRLKDGNRRFVGGGEWPEGLTPPFCSGQQRAPQPGHDSPYRPGIGAVPLRLDFRLR